MNKSMLCKVMKDNGYSQERLAEEVGVDRSTLNRKLNGFRKGFCITEAQAIGKILGMTEEQMMKVFFDQSTS